MRRCEEEWERFIIDASEGRGAVRVRQAVGCSHAVVAVINSIYHSNHALRRITKDSEEDYCHTIHLGMTEGLERLSLTGLSLRLDRPALRLELFQGLSKSVRGCGRVWGGRECVGRASGK